jgi:Raf kinase inhibitor-like YbhB/YbcL family protein
MVEFPTLWRWFVGAIIIAIAALVFFFNHPFMRYKDNGYNESTTTPMMNSTLSLTCSAFEDGGMIPARYTCDAGNPPAGGNPPLSFSGVPIAAKSLVLIMDDPDVPRALKPDGVFDHWILFNIPPETKEIASGMTVGEPGANGAGKNQYSGPCPPSQYEPSEHRYVFKLYALDAQLSLQAGASKMDVENAMQGHVLAQAQLVGRYKRK